MAADPGLTWHVYVLTPGLSLVDDEEEEAKAVGIEGGGGGATHKSISGLTCCQLASNLGFVETFA